jgi:hypothetical protein
MKLKKLLIITMVCLVVASIFGNIVVFAPPQTPLLPAPIEVINPPDSSLNVITPEGQSLDVTLDEPIEVVNQAGTSLDVSLDEPIAVTLDEPIDVKLDEPIDVLVTNINSATDISGWLHTTQSGKQIWNEFQPTGNSAQVFIDTEGYREITIVFDSSKDSVDFGIGWTIDGMFRWAEGWTYGNEKPPTYTTPDGDTPRYFFKTYPVQGETLEIFWYAAAGVLYSGEGVSIAYYLTT